MFAISGEVEESCMSGGVHRGEHATVIKLIVTSSRDRKYGQKWIQNL